MAGAPGALDADWYLPTHLGVGESEAIRRRPESYGAGVWRRFTANALAVAGIVVLALIVAGTLLGPHLLKYGYDEMHLTAQNLPPGPQHWFGTDRLGRDTFVRIWVGGRISLFIGLAAAAIDLGIGAAYGGISGYAGGGVDAVMMRIVDILYGIPFLLVVILLLVVIGSGLRSIVIAIALVNWLGMARLVRGQVLQLKSQEYVLAARALGVPPWRIIVRHLVPNALGPILVWLSYNVPQAIFTEAFLSYIGLGIQPPLASWGSMVSDSTEVFRLYPYEFFFPAVAISVTMLAFYVVSDGLGDALSPRTRR